MVTTCSSSTLSTRQLANKTSGWLTITDTIHALGLRFGGSELTLCATSSQTSAWAHMLCHQVQPSWHHGVPRDGCWLCPALRDTLSPRATGHRGHVLCKVLTERDKYFKRLLSYASAMQPRLLWKVSPQGVRGTLHALGTAVCEPVPPNVSSVANNVSWRGLLVAPNVSSRPALCASPSTDNVELLHVSGWRNGT